MVIDTGPTSTSIALSLCCWLLEAPFEYLWNLISDHLSVVRKSVYLCMYVCISIVSFINNYEHDLIIYVGV